MNLKCEVHLYRDFGDSQDYIERPYEGGGGRKYELGDAKESS